MRLAHASLFDCRPFGPEPDDQRYWRQAGEERVMSILRQGSSISIGASVFTADGKELGTVKEVSQQCFKVDAPMEPDYWLADDCIAEKSTERVDLLLTNEDLERVVQVGPDHTGLHIHD
jgi:hypothetical protein